MSGFLGSVWRVYRAYTPNATRDRQSAAPARFGAFEATYLPGGYAIRPPRNDVEAQRMYNHIRTLAFWLDAAPLLSDLGLPFRAGLDDIISLVPIYGDILSSILQLYQVYLCFLFGVPIQILGYMFLNVIIDTVVGIIPLLGDFLDNLFKSNLRNLALLEDYLLTNPKAIDRFHILIMPESNEFIPKTSTGRFAFFGSGKKGADEEREKERVTGKVRKSRRMGKDEGAASFGRGTGAGQMGVGTGTGTRMADPVYEPAEELR